MILKCESCIESGIFPTFFDWMLFIPGPQPLSSCFEICWVQGSRELSNYQTHFTASAGVWIRVNTWKQNIEISASHVHYQYVQWNILSATCLFILQRHMTVLKAKCSKHIFVFNFSFTYLNFLITRRKKMVILKLHFRSLWQTTECEETPGFHLPVCWQNFPKTAWSRILLWCWRWWHKTTICYLDIRLWWSVA